MTKDHIQCQAFISDFNFPAGDSDIDFEVLAKSAEQECRFVFGKVCLLDCSSSVAHTTTIFLQLEVTLSQGGASQHHFSSLAPLK